MAEDDAGVEVELIAQPDPAKWINESTDRKFQYRHVNDFAGDPVILTAWITEFYDGPDIAILMYEPRHPEVESGYWVANIFTKNLGDGCVGMEARVEPGDVPKIHMEFIFVVNRAMLVKFECAHTSTQTLEDVYDDIMDLVETAQLFVDAVAVVAKETP
jgi:hypothetical protein